MKKIRDGFRHYNFLNILLKSVTQRETIFQTIEFLLGIEMKNSQYTLRIF